MRTFDKLQESRLAKLRLGQSVGEIAELPSDPEIRMILVPITDADYIKALSMADAMDAGNSAAGLAMRDTTLREAILLFSAREISDWQTHFFEGLDEVASLGVNEVNYLYDVYLEMTYLNSPSMNLLSEEEIELLKKVWQQIEWSELSGPQLYAAQRFLNSIQSDLLRDSYSGSPSTLKSTQTLTTPTPVASASPDTATQP